MSDLPATPGSSPPGKRLWLGKLATVLASAAGGITVNDLSGSLGYHGLAGAFALFGVVAAASWIRALDSRARLVRLAPWLFLAPAAFLAATAALFSGPAAYLLAAFAAMLTLGAVLITKELQSVGRLLAGIALIVGGVAVIEAGAVRLAGGNASLGAVIVLGGIALIVGGVGHIGDWDRLAGAGLIVAGAIVILAGILIIESQVIVSPAGERMIGIFGIFWFGLGFVSSGRVLVSGGKSALVALYPEAHNLSDFKRYSVSAKSASASAGAVLTAVIVRGASATLAWAGIIMYLLAVFVLVAALISPPVISRRLRLVLDWFTVPPAQETRKSGPAQ